LGFSAYLLVPLLRFPCLPFDLSSRFWLTWWAHHQNYFVTDTILNDVPAVITGVHMKNIGRMERNRMNHALSHKCKAQSMTTMNQHGNSTRNYPVKSISFMKRRTEKNRPLLSLLAVALGVLCGPAVSAQEGKTYPTSRVEKFTFGDTLEEQIAQLKDNPQLEHFRKLRERQSSRDRVSASLSLYQPDRNHERPDRT
jgi:hypothetical protein